MELRFLCRSAVMFNKIKEKRRPDRSLKYKATIVVINIVDF